MNNSTQHETDPGTLASKLAGDREKSALEITDEHLRQMGREHFRNGPPAPTADFASDYEDEDWGM
jgi:hypothetical protein